MTDRWGLLARCDQRGIGSQTFDRFVATSPAKTLVVCLGPLTPYKERPERFPSEPDRQVMVAAWDGSTLPEAAIDWLLDGTDAVYAVETFYDRRLPTMARERKVRPVVHVNPELYRAVDDTEEQWLPSPWLAEAFPGAEVVPVSPPADAPTGCTGDRIVHVAGHPAAADRAGTEITLRAFARLPIALRKRCIVYAQSRITWSIPEGVEVIVADRPDRYEPYRDAAVLVQPRRYGGLSLILEEALACGVGVIAVDREPERTFYAERFKAAGLPMLLVPITRARQFRAVARVVSSDGCDPGDVAGKIYEAVVG